MHRAPAPLPSRHRAPSLADRLIEVGFALLVLALFVLLLAFCPGVSRGAATPSPCEPAPTRVVLFTLADATDHAWEVWTGAQPGPLVTRMLADSLRGTPAREVHVLDGTGRATPRALDDAPALERARADDADIVVTGRLEELLIEDRREGGKLWRWGVGAPDSRSRARVRLVLRVLDARDGSVIIETAATRERSGRATAVVDRSAAPALVAPDAFLGQALGEVLADLTRTIGLRLEARGQGRVATVQGEWCALDLGTARGHFEGQRLEVWRSGIETYDEELMRVGEEVRVGMLVVTGIDMSGRVSARRVEGDAQPGDRIRACAGATPALSLKR